MIDQKNLKSLIKLMVDNDLTELELKDAKGEQVTLKRGRGEAVVHPAAPAYALPASAAPAPVATPAPAVAPAADSGLVPICSPMVGTFYTAASPDAKPLASVGDKVGPDTVVCIIEAMKVFNEIKAETSGVVEKIQVANGRAVEFGQALFLIRPG